jgi:hypothetical protein
VRSAGGKRTEIDGGALSGQNALGAYVGEWPSSNHRQPAAGFLGFRSARRAPYSRRTGPRLVFRGLRATDWSGAFSRPGAGPPRLS